MQLPPIRYAREAGYHCITLDNRPDNPGHALAHKTYDISITERERITQICEEESIDGLISYASDVGAPTVAYVGNALGLVSNPLDAVLTLTQKNRFRAFLSEHGFRCPGFRSVESARALEEFVEETDAPVIVKPVDSSGSKGVTKVTSDDQIASAFGEAQRYSICGNVIAEEFVQRSGYQIAGDGLLVDGKLVFRSWANEHFEKLANGLVPIGESFPVVLDEAQLTRAHEEVQSIFDKLGMRHGAINFDFMLSDQGELFILELGPRNGGNLIPEVIKLIDGVDLIAATVEQALGNLEDLPVPSERPGGYYASYILHAWEKGRFEGVRQFDSLAGKVIQETVTVKAGDEVDMFHNAAFGIGSMILRFDSQEEMLTMMDNMENHLAVDVTS